MITPAYAADRHPLRPSRSPGERGASPVQVVIPARDEAENLGGLIEALGEVPGHPITVVDGASRDETAVVARAAGARVIRAERAGKGFAVIAGLLASDPGPVFLCDADVTGVSPGAIKQLGRLARERRAPVARLSIGRSPRDAPVTTLVGRPLLAALGLTEIREPLGGLVVVDRDFVLQQHLPGGWGFDVALTVAAIAAHKELPELTVTGVRHRSKEIASYVEMAEEVVFALLRARGIISWTHEDCVLCRRNRRRSPRWRGAGEAPIPRR
jgi:glycosyltransferase involved in cell wall biosynthesis